MFRRFGSTLLCVSRNVLCLLLTFPFRRAGTIIAVLVTGARSAISARIAGTVIDSAIRGIAHEAGITDALGPVRIFDANTVR